MFFHEIFLFLTRRDLYHCGLVSRKINQDIFQNVASERLWRRIFLRDTAWDPLTRKPNTSTWKQLWREKWKLDWEDKIRDFPGRCFDENNIWFIDYDKGFTHVATHHGVLQKLQGKIVQREWKDWKTSSIVSFHTCVISENCFFMLQEYRHREFLLSYFDLDDPKSTLHKITFMANPFAINHLLFLRCNYLWLLNYQHVILMDLQGKKITYEFKLPDNALTRRDVSTALKVADIVVNPSRKSALLFCLTGHNVLTVTQISFYPWITHCTIWKKYLCENWLIHKIKVENNSIHMLREEFVAKDGRFCCSMSKITEIFDELKWIKKEMSYCNYICSLFKKFTYYFKIWFRLSERIIDPE